MIMKKIFVIFIFLISVIDEEAQWKLIKNEVF